MAEDERRLRVRVLLTSYGPDAVQWVSHKGRSATLLLPALAQQCYCFDVMRAFILLSAFLSLLCSCTAPTLTGGDADEHGCRASAGYQWSEVRQECIRIFEKGVRLEPQAAHLNASVSAFVVLPRGLDRSRVELFLPEAGNKALLLRRVSADQWSAERYVLTSKSGDRYELKDVSGMLLYRGPEEP